MKRFYLVFREGEPDVPYGCFLKESEAIDFAASEPGFFVQTLVSDDKGLYKPLPVIVP